MCRISRRITAAEITDPVVLSILTDLWTIAEGEGLSAEYWELRYQGDWPNENKHRKVKEYQKLSVGMALTNHGNVHLMEYEVDENTSFHGIEKHLQQTMPDCKLHSIRLSLEAALAVNEPPDHPTPD